MSIWKGKYIIGLTGNIATGKSVVRRMLEHLGAYGIDADALAHRAIAKGAPGYGPVIKTFGEWIIGEDGQIDRARLGRIVFADTEALRRLEAIVHPPVRQAVDVLVRLSKHPVVVIEAIKLLEGELRDACDSIWVTYASPEVQLARLMEKRGMSTAAAQMRIESQPPQQEKLAAADVVIRNEGSFDTVWHQVLVGWSKVPAAERASWATAQTRELRKDAGELFVTRARPGQAGELAAFINKISGGRLNLDRDDIMAAFGEKAFLMLMKEGKTLGVAGWQVENLIARTMDVYLEPALPAAQALRVLMAEVESASRELQCEVSLLFLPVDLAKQQAIWKALNYVPRRVEDLRVRAWKEAAVESMPKNTVMLFKKLRKDRVLRPV